MAVKMRLRREGKKKQPFYRVVVADVRSPRDGRFIEDIGYYQPLHNPSTVSIDHDRALHWLRNGVQPSDAVRKLLRIEGIWEEFKPGDTGKDRSAKHAARAAATAAKDRARREAEDAARRQRAAAAGATAEAQAEQAEETEVAADLTEAAIAAADADQAQGGSPA
jgi:small subunit ribosomal protein S16